MKRIDELETFEDLQEAIYQARLKRGPLTRQEYIELTYCIGNIICLQDKERERYYLLKGKSDDVMSEDWLKEFACVYRMNSLNNVLIFFEQYLAECTVLI